MPRVLSNKDQRRQPHGSLREKDNEKSTVNAKWNTDEPEVRYP